MGKGRGKRQQQNNAGPTCGYCRKPGHTAAMCWNNPQNKNKPQGQQQQQQGGGKAECTFCQRSGHSVDGCWDAHPELKGQRGKKQQQQQQQPKQQQQKQQQQKQQIRCAYCLQMGHDLDGCSVLHPELTNPFTNPQQPQWNRPVKDGYDSNNKPQPPARLNPKIRHAEQLGRDLTPEGIRHYAKVQRIQGWHPARETYYTLPLYGAAVDRAVYLAKNDFARPVGRFSYHAYDTSGDLIMCTCGCPEGFECQLQQWVRKALKDKELEFSDRSEEAFGQVIKDGMVGHGDIASIF